MSGKEAGVAVKVIDDNLDIVDREKDTLMNNYRLREFDSHVIDGDVEVPKTNSTLGGATDRKSHGTIADSKVSDGHGVYEERFVKESIVTIDTTDKRSRGNVLRAQHTYAAKKTVAQGMMDVALITANANQLRYLVEYQRNSPLFFVNVFLIVVSLLLQIAVGVSLIFKGRFDLKGQGKSPQARMINNYVVVAVFLITIINVFVAAFSVSATSVPPISPVAPQFPK